MQRTRGVKLEIARLECSEFLRSDFKDRNVDNPCELDGWQMTLEQVRGEWNAVEGREGYSITPAMYAGLEMLEAHSIVPLDVAQEIQESYHGMGVHWVEEHGRNINYGGEEAVNSYANWCMSMSEACYEIAGEIARLRTLVGEYDASVVTLASAPTHEYRQLAADPPVRHA